jgi:hypothetical protein
MKLELTGHAKERMKQYAIEEKLLLDAIENPDRVSETYAGRKMYQKRLNGYILRVIIEENEQIKTVITLYKARSDRYEI